MSEKKLNIETDASFSSQESKTSFKAKAKEWFRKQLVGLKRNPQNIALLFLAISLIVYSLSMTSVSNTTSYLQTASMGICSFVTYLMSILVFVIFFNTFPKRKNIKLIMFIILLVVIALIIFCDVIYYVGTITPFTRTENQIKWDKVKEPYHSSIVNTRAMLIGHMVLLVLTFLLVALYPWYKNLIKKINTSVEVEAGAVLNEVERSDD